MGGGVTQAAGTSYGQFANDTLLYNTVSNTWSPGTKLLFNNQNDYSGPTGVLYRH